MSIDAMRQALEALEEAAYATEYYPDHPLMKRCSTAITALRAAIEQAEKQEPVAWINWSALTGKPRIGWECESEIASEPLYAAPFQQEKQERAYRVCSLGCKNLGACCAVPMCESVATTPPAAPVQEPDEWSTGCPECGMDAGCDCDSGTWNPPAAQRQPLTLAQIAKVFADAGLPLDDGCEHHLEIARAIEAAHGITGEKE